MPVERWKCDKLQVRGANTNIEHIRRKPHTQTTTPWTGCARIYLPVGANTSTWRNPVSNLRSCRAVGNDFRNYGFFDFGDDFLERILDTFLLYFWRQVLLSRSFFLRGNFLDLLGRWLRRRRFLRKRFQQQLHVSAVGFLVGRRRELQQHNKNILRCFIPNSIHVFLCICMKSEGFFVGSNK